ncbi:putative ribonuclease H-like domain-containing protein [Tanacetum coccineum]
MDLETAQTTTTAKFRILKQGCIENGNSFKPTAQTTTNADGTSTSLIPGPVTTKEKVQKKNDVKARNMLLMALPNEHLIIINQYKDAKTLFAAIQTRFGANEATKKTQKTLLKKITASSSSSSQHMAFVSSPIITNEVNTTYGVSTANTQVSPASTQVSTASTQVSTANLSDAIVYAFLASQRNGSQLVHEDLEQIHKDDLEEVDLKWQLALLWAWFGEVGGWGEWGGWGGRGKGGWGLRWWSWGGVSSRRTVNMEETSSKAMVAIDGARFDWSYMVDDEVPTNMDLMDFLDSKNEVIFCEQLAVLKRDISYKGSKISMLKSELEKLKQEKESNQFKIKKFDNASKSLDKLIGSQIPDKSRKGVGFVSYNVVPPPPTGLFLPPNLDLSYSGLEEFQQPEFEGYGPKPSKSVSEDTSNEVKESPDAPLVEELVSDDKLEKKIVFPTVAKMEFVRPKQQEKPVRKPVKYAKMYRSQSPRGNQRNWNNQKSQQLGSDFVMYNKACFVCGSFDHVQANCNYHQRERVVSGNNYTRVNYNYSAKKAHPSAHRNMVPRAVLMKTGLRPLNTARPVNTAHPKTTVYSARPMSHFSKSAQSTVKRPYQIRTTLTNKNFSQKVNTAKGKFYTARPKAVNTARPNSAVVNAVEGRSGHLQKEDQGYVDSGCSRHMTGNMSYLSDFKEFDGGYGRVTTTSLEATHVDFFGDETELDMSNITTTYLVLSTPNTRIHKDHSLDHVIGDVQSVEPKKLIQALTDSSWIEAMQDELLQFKLQKVWTLVDLHMARVHRTKTGVYRNKKDERGYAYSRDFVVYQMDVKSAFLYGKIKEEVYVCQPPGFEDPEFRNRVYKRGQIDKTLFIKRIKSDILLVQVYVDDIIFGSTKKELCTEFEKLMHKKFQMSSMGELTFFLGLQVTQKDDGIFISQGKYVDEILKKFGFSTVKTAVTPMETSKPLHKDAEAEDVDVHLYRSMIGSLMYLKASRPDIMFTVCACVRFQVTPKVLHLHAVKRIFRYLKGQPKLGIWYPKDSPFDLEAYIDSDYAGASLDSKYTTGGCQFLKSRLISWQYKKQTIVSNSTTEAEYVAASSCCGQVLWTQNQMLDYGYNFMNTKIFIDNESTICIVKNLLFHSKTKNIEIRHHFIRDSNEKKLIQMIKIHIDHNVTDLLTKAFDVGRFQYLIASIGILNP